MLIHGSAGDARTWQQQIPAFAERWRVIAYSRRFHTPNANIAPGEDHAMTQHVADLASVAERLAGGRAHLVGHSYGAFLALVLALQQPALSASLVLAGPPVIPLFTSYPPRPAEILRLPVTRPYTAFAHHPVRRDQSRSGHRGGQAGRHGNGRRTLWLGGAGPRAVSGHVAERMPQAQDNLSPEELLGDSTVDVPVLQCRGRRSGGARCRRTVRSVPPRPGSRALRRPTVQKWFGTILVFQPTGPVLARAFDLTEEKIDAARRGGTALSHEGAVAARLAEELAVSPQAQRSTIDALLAFLGPREICERIIGIGFYLMQSRVIETLEIEMEEQPVPLGRVGESAEVEAWRNGGLPPAR